MSEEWENYVNDPRRICKYGAKCYQKNPDHHKTYKHPPKKRGNSDNSPANKRFKASRPRPKSPNASPRPKSPIKDNNNSNDIEKAGSGEKKNDDDDLNESSSSEHLSTGENSKFKLPETITYHDCDSALIKELFLVTMPKDFYDFFKCLQEEPSFEKLLKSVNLELIGPFDLLLGRLPILEQKEMYLIHWRFFYDPPEFQAVLKKAGKSEYHIGYFRDDPESDPVFVASADSSKDCHITPVAENIFSAVHLYLGNEKKSSPFTSIACQKLMEKVKTWAESLNYKLDEYNIKKRLGQSVTKSFHGAGIVVPYDKKTQLGYRKLVETDANLKKLFTRLESAKSKSEKDAILSEIQPVITYANIAVDECDFGTGLEAGIDLFCSGIKELQSSAVSSLKAVYSLLNRQAFGEIIQVHMKHRRKGPNMSILSISE